MSRLLYRIIPVVLILFVGVGVSADRLELVDGTVIWGKVIGLSEYTVDYEYFGGIATFWLTDIYSLNFLEPPQRPPELVLEGMLPAFQTGFVTAVPAGTPIQVQLQDGISSKVYGAEYIFTGRVMADVVADGITLVKRGTVVTGRMIKLDRPGRRILTVELTSWDIGGIAYPIEAGSVSLLAEGTGTGQIKARRPRRVKSSLRQGQTVATGGPILTSGSTVQIPAGALLEFRLTTAFIYYR